jgi:hypothetical protein
MERRVKQFFYFFIILGGKLGLSDRIVADYLYRTATGQYLFSTIRDTFGKSFDNLNPVQKIIFKSAEVLPMV